MNVYTSVLLDAEKISIIPKPSVTIPPLHLDFLADCLTSSHFPFRPKKVLKCEPNTLA